MPFQRARKNLSNIYLVSHGKWRDYLAEKKPAVTIMEYLQASDQDPEVKSKSHGDDQRRLQWLRMLSLQRQPSSWDVSFVPLQAA